MVITVAGEKKEVKDGLTLPELIEQEVCEETAGRFAARDEQ